MSDADWILLLGVVLAIAAIFFAHIVLRQRVDDLEKDLEARMPRTLRDFNAQRPAETRTARTDRAARAARLPNHRPGPALDASESHPKPGA